MNFAAPLMLGLGALAAPIVVLYILKVKRRKVRIPYLRLWDQLVVETKARALFKRLKRLYSLLLQLLILGSLVMAVAQPDLELTSKEKESIVLLLDVSASMQVVEDGENGAPDRTRYELMLERASELVEGRSREDEMLIATVSDRVDVLCSFNRNKIRLREALDAAAATTRSLDADAAIAFAREVTLDRERPVVLFLSDGNAGAVPAALEGLRTDASPEPEATEETAGAAPDEAPKRELVAQFVPIGSAEDNVAILRFTARKNESLGTDYLLAVLRNYGEEPIETRLELTRDGNAIAVEPITLPPGEDVTWSKTLTVDQGGTLRLAIDHEDAFGLDNEAFAVVRPVRLRKIGLIVAEEDQATPFVVAFGSMIEVVAGTSFFTTPEQYLTMTEERREADVTICLGTIPEGLPSRGNLILMDTPVPDFLPATEAGRDPEPTVWDWDREHLLNRFLNYRDLPLPPARILRMDDGEALVSGLEGPLVAAFDVPDRRVVYVAFDMTADLFPFRLAFPMLLRNAIAWFEVEEDVVLEPTYAPGATITPLRRLDVEEAKVTFLRGEEPAESALELLEGRFYFTDTAEPGAYVFNLGGRNFPTAVNLFDADESAIAPSEGAEDAAAGTASTSFFNRDLWALLAAAALALWTLEWITFHRRITE